MKLIDATAEEEKRCIWVSRDVALKLIDDTAKEKKKCMKVREDAALKLIDEIELIYHMFLTLFPMEYK